MTENEHQQEMERIRIDIAQEKQMKEMLEQSKRELQVTVDELDKRMDSLDDENNEWKTRFDTQEEINEKLQKQILLLHEKLDDARKTYKESKQPKHSKQADDPNELTPYYVKQLEKERDILAGQLRDLEWRLDQESKAYHKANEERKNYMMEISTAKKDVRHELKHKRPVLSEPGDSPRSLRSQNIPQDHRVIDPKKGPIKKTAAVKNLPKLDNPSE